MILTKNIKVKMGGRSISHYKKLGYDVKLFETLEIPIEHLIEGSHYRVDVSCDYCKREFSKVYKSLMLERKKSITKKDCCTNCIYEKTSETNMTLYGVSNSMFRGSVVKKLKDTIFKRFGVYHITQNKEIAKKAGLAQKNMSEEKKSARREKSKKTMQERYGVDFALQLEKTRVNLFLTQKKASSQQKQIYKMLWKIYGKNNVKINFPESKVCLDIVLYVRDVKINIEYDSWYWHNPISDRRRDEFVKSRGYKILRIKSSKKIPSVEMLADKINKLIDSNYMFASIVLDDWSESGYREEGRQYE